MLINVDETPKDMQIVLVKLSNGGYGVAKYIAAEKTFSPASVCCTGQFCHDGVRFTSKVVSWRTLDI